MKEQYILSAIDSFLCIADKCPENCCHRFVVPLSQHIYRKWQALAASDRRKEWLLAALIHGEGGHAIQLRQVAGQGVSNCVCLQSDGLCRIHAELGAEFLPEICKNYPRASVELPNRSITFATMSCPEIARLVLLDDISPVFRFVPATGLHRKAANKAVNEQVAVFLYPHIRKLFSMQEFALNLRLTYLARLLAEVAALSQKKQMPTRVLANFAAACEENLQRMLMETKMGKLVTNPHKGLHMWNLLRSGALRFQLFQACGLGANLPIVQLAARAELDAEAKTQFYRELMAMRAASRNRLQDKEKIFARYLEAHLMLEGFPFYHKRHLVVNFLCAVFPFAIVQMLLWCKASIASQLSDADIVDTVMKVEAKIVHSREIAPTLEQNPALLEIQHYFDWFLEVC